MKLSSNALLTVALVAVLVLVGTDVHAQTTGVLYTKTRDLVTGNIGFFIGLLLAVWGIWTWVVKQETMAGIFMIVGGVLITISPGVLNFMSSIVNPVAKLGATSLTEVKGSNETKDLIGIGSGQ
ncbi:MAG: hypothetical protein WAZ18_00300 [Alphaproteobacteria bacterium]